MSQKTPSAKRRKWRRSIEEEERLPLHRRERPGLYGDYQIIDENGRTCWASDWCRRVWIETQPRGVWQR